MIWRILLLWLLVANTAYGAVPGHRPVAYGNGVDYVQSCAWRGRAVDVPGTYHLGHRDLETDSGQWSSRDPRWNDRDPNGQSFCGGDPNNYTDPDGLCVSGFEQGSQENSSTPANAGMGFELGYTISGMTGSYSQGLGNGIKDIGIGTWDSVKGMAQGGWALTGGSVVNLWEGKQTTYGAIGNGLYNFTTSADARANTCSGIKNYTAETFTDSDKFSQRVGGAGLTTLLTLGASEGLQSLRVVGKGGALTSTIGGNGMDAALFKRIQAAFQRNGGVMQANAESSKMLKALRAEGIAFDAKTIALTENPSTSAVYEELIHTAQMNRGMTDVIQMEIEAAQKLINNADLYNIPASETQQTINRLNNLLQQQKP